MTVAKCITGAVFGRAVDHSMLCSNGLLTPDVLQQFMYCLVVVCLLRNVMTCVETVVSLESTPF